MGRWRVLIGTVAALMLEQSAAGEDFLTGARLYDDVARYASFGSDRFGLTGDRLTADWIAAELQAEPEILEPVARASAETVWKIVRHGQHSFN
jgi:hypothetical protein